MENNLILILLAAVAVIAVVIILIIRNQKDKKDLMRNLIERDNATLPKESDTEVDPTAVK